MISMAENIHKCKHIRRSKIDENFLDTFANISMIDGNQYNDTHPLVNAAGGLGQNPNILGHDVAMKAVDSDKLEISMAEELEKCRRIKFMRLLKRSMCVKYTPSLDQYSHTNEK